eukprot:gnl/Hemi2/26055_TR8747_c0_g1_i1.p1 gnl/Hemi2/26055_TR8747_c0_g1~~gnl/Hemi2/26055_TR8747_c0_g1_i1.p1  ORF type:complete len:358 (-),score=98.69 gnl/Hemi2/26055_TR8747_c0_g1_i1:119-1153(-)
MLVRSLARNLVRPRPVAGALRPFSLKTHLPHPVEQYLGPEPQTVSIIGAGIAEGQPKPGVEKGPQAMRDAGVIDRIKEIGWQVNDCGDVHYEHVADDTPSQGGAKKPRTVGNASRILHETALREARAKRFVLTIGGDHCIAIGSISALLTARPDMCVIWVDAHADINNEDTSTSGNIHGMPVGFLMKLVNSENVPGFGFLKDTPTLKPDRIVYVGLRDIDAGERMALKQLGILAFDMHAVDKFGIGKVMEMALDHVNPYKKRPIHLSFDIDAMDPTLAPSTGTPVLGGLTFRESAFLCETVAETGMCTSMDIVEVNPTIDPDAAYQTVSIGSRLVACALGETIL